MTALPGGPGDTLDGLEIRHVHPYEATKAYRCPGCHGDIPARTGHEVVVPTDEPDLRRHWHSRCWHIEAARRLGRRR